MKKNKLAVRDMALCALFSALLAICAWISIPVLEISFTMQTFGAFLACGVLGGKLASVSCLVYLLLGAVGLPVFTGFRGGLGSLLGVTGGYIVGFLAACLVYWLMTALLGNRPWVQLGAMVLGLAACYALGTVWFMVVYVRSTGPIGFGAVLGKCVVPFLIPDGCKVALAFGLSQKLGSALRR